MSTTVRGSVKKTKTQRGSRSTNKIRALTRKELEKLVTFTPGNWHCNCEDSSWCCSGGSSDF